MHALVCFISSCGLPPVCVEVSHSESFPPLLHSALASHTDVAGLAAGVLLGIDCGQTHQLVPADLSHRARRQV